VTSGTAAATGASQFALSPASIARLLIGMLCAATAIAWSPSGVAQESSSPFDEVVERYVAEGLRGNLAMRSEGLEVERAAAALAEARAGFLPSVTLDARYSRAEGGRTIDLPLGTALNPVYSTLNEMLVAQGQEPRFPLVRDETVNFLREREQDTRVVMRQPLFAPAIPAAVRAQRALLDASSYRQMAIGRALRRDITLAYVEWLKARNAVEIVVASEALLRENLRVNQSLFDNGKITEDQVLRARAELLAIEQQRREIENLTTQAQSYFNFLLNRNLQAAIEPAAPPTAMNERDAALEALWSRALERRPEIAQLEQLRAASEEQVRIARKSRWPTLALGIDAGTQGEEYRFGDGYNFGVVSLVFTWRLFDGGADAARVHQARTAAKQVVLREEELAQQIRLEVQQAYDRLQTARASLATAQARAEAARAAFRIASRKRDEGVINQVEFIDARTTLTSAEMNYATTQFDVLARRAELEYATANGDLPLDSGV
jgi:outer membrane protein